MSTIYNVTIYDKAPDKEGVNKLTFNDVDYSMLMNLLDLSCTEGFYVLVDCRQYDKSINQIGE